MRGGSLNVPDWKREHLAAGPEECIHHLIAVRAEQMPDAIAVECAGQMLTYHELERRANQLAHYLCGLGVRPEVPVGVLMGRSCDLLVSLLGILKAGGVYVPLDPDYPTGRLMMLIEDAHPHLLITWRELAHRVLGNNEALNYLYFEQEWPLIEEKPIIPPAVHVDPENAAYIMYTSGSSGRPKGALVPHRGIGNLIQVICDILPVTTNSRVLQFASLGFDASISEFFMALVAGATLVLVPRTGQELAQELTSITCIHAITTVTLPPSLLAMLTFADMPYLQTVVSAGESCPWSIAERVPSHVRFFNGYGLTETTVGNAYYLVTAQRPGSQTVPLGQAIPRTSIYVLDEEMQPLPIGFPGEIYIGGIGVARGYIGNPALTAERFLPDPWSSEPGARLYRTGDTGRSLQDGSIAFLGRVDRQVKLRGVRIELEEVEGTLIQYPDVQEVAVIVQGDAADEQQLIAYIVVKAAEALDMSALRAFLAQRLPVSMIPTAFIIMDLLPLTVNGKVDRTRLPQPTDRLSSTRHFVPPRTPLEKQLARIWQEILHVERVGLTDNFFELGGHSLSVVRVLAHLRTRCQLEFPVRTFFEHPTIAGVLEHLRPAVHLEPSRPGMAEFEPRSSDEYLPLSSSQERIWLLCQLEPGNPFYNTTEALKISGPLRIGVLEHALNEVVYRHEILRTRFALRDGQPVQSPVSHLELALQITDLRDLSASERGEQMRRLTRLEAERALDLQAGPLLRATLLWLEQEEAVFLLTIHHLIADAWSGTILLQELLALYRARLTNKPASLPELPMQYSDFVRWEQRWLQTVSFEHHRAFWQRQLATPLPVIDLPLDRRRSAVQSVQGASCSFVLPQGEIERLQELARQEEATLFMVLLTAFKVLLFRSTGQNDLLVGTPVANRRWAELDTLIGCFTNTLAIRTLLPETCTFREALRIVRQSCLEAFDHQDMPFEHIISGLHIRGYTGHHSLFQVFFVMQNFDGPELSVPDLTLERFQPKVDAAPFDLILSFEPDSRGLVGCIQYRTDLFDDVTIHCLMNHLMNVIGEAIIDPDCSIAMLSLMSEAERAQLLELQSQGTSGKSDRDEFCVHELFARQASLAPDAIAVECQGQCLSYGELDRLSSNVAAWLRRVGVGSEVRVGLLMERSLELIISIIAILRAGGSYVPLDVDNPSDRLTLILQDAKVHVLLTHRRLRTQLVLPAVQEVYLEHIWDSLNGEQMLQTSEIPLEPEHLAYIIYTSGSSGKPKGVGVTHRNVCRLFTRSESYFQFSANDVWTLFHSYAFDFSVWELWGALLYGGRLVVVPYQVSRSLEDFYALVIREGVTILNQTPSAFQQFMQVDERARDRVPQTYDCHALRLIIFGGEALDPARLQSWVQRHGDSKPQLVNMYGITETTVHVTYRRVSRQDVFNTKRSLIGRPLSDLQVYVLDRFQRMAPFGVTGELYVGGAGLARGYIEQPALTAERFLPDPFGSEPGARLYRTGDLGRYLPTGELEYLGRLDQQVKIRGFRVELGEIESILKTHPGMEDVVVTLWEPSPGDHRLVAYMVTDPENVPTSVELRGLLRGKVPEYMIPAAFIALEQIPLTLNGKVDHRRLPAPGAEHMASPRHYVQPRTMLEEQLAQIWSEVLAIDRISIHDDFFELGGHSLLATQIFSRIRDVCRIDAPIRLLFETPVLADLAQALARHQATTTGEQSLEQLLIELEQFSGEEVESTLFLCEDEAEKENHSD